MFASLKGHWLSTVVGIIEGSLVSFAATANLDQLTFKQALLAYSVALAMAVKGFVTADAKSVPVAEAK
jgi:surface antigen